MWLMNFLPNWIFHAILLAGVLGLVASFVLKFIPFISTYAFPIQVVSILLVVTGVWFEGAISNQAAWEARVKEMEAKVADAEAKSSEANVQIVTKIVKKTKRIHDKGDEIISYIDREVVKNNEVIKFVENCPIPDIIIKTHNAAALNQPIESKK
jgi:translation elongation factor EF-Tu-like GTPase